MKPCICLDRHNGSIYVRLRYGKDNRRTLNLGNFACDSPTALLDLVLETSRSCNAEALRALLTADKSAKLPRRPGWQTRAERAQRPKSA